MSFAFAAAASFLGALLSALGMGGGSVLILYLTMAAGMAQLEAQGINLVFFLPVAAVALFFHRRNGLVRWRLALPFGIFGCAGVYFGQRLALLAGSGLLGRLFGGFLLVIGLRELFSKGNRSTGGQEEKK
jgi:uncharacterized membrane protein YfcA